MWLGVCLHHSWVGPSGPSGAPPCTAMSGGGDGRAPLLAGDGLLVNSRDLIAKAIDEDIEPMKIVLVQTSLHHVVRALVSQLGVA